jgi:hypothetical protein
VSTDTCTWASTTSATATVTTSTGSSGVAVLKSGSASTLTLTCTGIVTPELSTSVLTSPYTSLSMSCSAAVCTVSAATTIATQASISAGTFTITDTAGTGQLASAALTIVVGAGCIPCIAGVLLVTFIYYIIDLLCHLTNFFFIYRILLHRRNYQHGCLQRNC